MTISNAMKYCQSKDSVLAAIETEEENNDIADIVRIYFTARELWLGAEYKSLNNHGHWKWTTEEEPVEFAFTNWFPGSNRASNNYFLYSDITLNSSYWYDASSEKISYPICEFKRSSKYI